MKLEDLWTIVYSVTKTPVMPLDSNPESDDDGMLVYKSKEAADLAASYKMETEIFRLDCESRRVVDVLADDSQDKKGGE